MRSTRNSSGLGFTTNAGHGSSLRELGAPLDQERAASMADEGGVAGALTDALAQALPHQVSELATPRVRAELRRILPWALLAGGLAVAAWAFRRRLYEYY
jgi:hypothetical protein